MALGSSNLQCRAKCKALTHDQCNVSVQQRWEQELTFPRPLEKSVNNPFLQTTFKLLCLMAPLTGVRSIVIT
jgi:hypothetical protein